MEPPHTGITTPESEEMAAVQAMCYASFAAAQAVCFGSVYLLCQPWAFGTRWAKSKNQPVKFENRKDMIEKIIIMFVIIGVVNHLIQSQNVGSVDEGARAGLAMFVPVFAAHCISAAWLEEPFEGMIIEMLGEFWLFITLGSTYGFIAEYVK
eukprot:195556_1